jgi:hypothetical protein
MIPSADPQVSALSFHEFHGLNSLLLGACTQAQTSAKNPARIIPAGHDAVLDDALICLSLGSFVKKKIPIAAAIGESTGPRLAN